MLALGFVSFMVCALSSVYFLYSLEQNKSNAAVAASGYAALISLCVSYVGFFF